MTIPGALGVRIIAWTVLVFVLVVCWVALPDPDHPLDSSLVSVPLALSSAPALLLATTAIRLRSRDELELVDIWTVTTVPVAGVAALSSANGFEVVLRSGRRLRSSAIGPSLAGMLVGHPSARRAVAEVEALLGRSLTVAPQWEQGDWATITRPRIKAILVCALYAVTVCLGTLAIGLAG